MDNIRKVRAVCNEFKVPLFLDACRFAENAMFIKLREKVCMHGFAMARSHVPFQGYKNKTVADIVLEMFSLVDGAAIIHCPVL